eukprot:6044633-Heterocapsa_arctica.AAC.1
MSETNRVVKRTKAIALAVREKVNIIKTAGQSKATYGAATDPFTQGLMLADKGELEPSLAITKKNGKLAQTN